MSLSHEPESREIFQKMAYPLELIYRGTEDAIVKATNQLEANGLPFEASAHATLTRLHARSFFKQYPSIFTVNELSNCGNLLIWQQNKFRLFKTLADGTPPTPGESRILQKHYNQEMTWQPHLLLLDGVEEDPFNYVVHWHITREGRFMGIKLAYPRRATAYRVEWKWDEPIPNPVLGMTQSKAPQHQEADSFDLDIKLRQLPLSGGDDFSG